MKSSASNENMVKVVKADGAEVLDSHANTVIGIDHVVAHFKSVDKTKEYFRRNFGLDEPKRIRKDIYPGVTQMFYRPGNGTVIEAIVFENSDEDNTNPDMFLWGITFLVDDLDKTKSLLGDNLSNPKNAVQKGRRIATLRHKNLGIGCNIAFMTKPPEKAKL